MKKLGFLFAALLLIGGVNAQEFDIPKTGAKIYLSSNAVELGADSETTLDLWIVRSKRAKKAEFNAPKFLGSEKLAITIEADQQNADRYKVRIKSEGVTPGAYFYTVTSRSAGMHKVTGTTVSVNVLPSERVVASDDN